MGLSDRNAADNKEAAQQDNARTFLLAAAIAALALGLFKIIDMDISFAVIGVMALYYGYDRYKKWEKKRSKDQELAARERADRMRRKREMAAREAVKQEEEEAKRKEEQERLAAEAKKRAPAEAPKPEEIKGKEYAIIVGEALKRLNYDIEYRQIVQAGEDAVHILAYRANEVCLVHCTDNRDSPITSRDISSFIADCSSIAKRSKFWQDDIIYLFAISGAIEEEAIDYIAEERKKHKTPIEYRVFGIA
ncbi:MAG: hypothetical protein LBU73_00890 [Helicobacteraceae bacterium]|jgi:hypothetical protein|nr:hypothetical protein [Helicobacteraceae bacterium]